MTGTATPTGTRHLDQGTPPDRYARGWHCLGLARDFGDGKPHAIDAFGGKLVVWQDSKGELNVLDGYCRHMGGDLTQGTVKGDQIACPFHDWRWGGDGKCKQIPYARRVPLRARTQRYETAIRNESLFIWYDPEGSAGDHDLLPPELPGLASGKYTDWFWETEHIEGSNCRELIDNVVDMAHFYYVHFAFPTSFRNVFEGQQATQFMESKGRPDVSGGYGSEELFLKSEATYYGPSYMINWLWTDYKGFKTEVVLVNTHIATGPNSFTLQYGILVAPVRGGRAGLPVASVVRAVLRRRRRHHLRHGRPLRVRGGHHEGQRVLAGRGRPEPREEGGRGRRGRDRGQRRPGPDVGHLRWRRSSPGAPRRSRTSASTPRPG